MTAKRLGPEDAKAFLVGKVTSGQSLTAEEMSKICDLLTTLLVASWRGFDHIKEIATLLDKKFTLEGEPDLANAAYNVYNSAQLLADPGMFEELQADIEMGLLEEALNTMGQEE